MNTLNQNVYKIYVHGFFYMFLIIVPIIIPFFESHGLSMTEILFIQGIFGVTVAVFEVPSAYLGDIWGRKQILILGSFITGLGFSTLYFAQGFYELLGYEILLGIGASFISGADLSILYDSLEDNRIVKMKAMGHFHALQLIGESIAALICAALILYSMNWVLWAQIFVGWIPFFVALTLKEPPIERMDGTHYENISAVFRFILKDSLILRQLFLNMTLWSVSTFTAVWLIQKYWQETGYKTSYLAFFWCGCNLTAAIVGKLAPSLEKKFGSVKLLYFLAFCSVMAYLIMGLFQASIAIFFALLFYISRGLNFTLYKEGFNHRIPAKFRNTANSINSLFFRLFFFTLGPLVGVIIDKYGIQYGLIFLGTFFIGIGIFLLRPFIKNYEQEISN